MVICGKSSPIHAKALMWEQVWSIQGTKGRPGRKEGYDITLEQKLETDNRRCCRPRKTLILLPAIVSIEWGVNGKAQ